MSTLESLESLVREWLRLDSVSSSLEPQNKPTRAEIQALWDDRNTEELDRRMRWTTTLYTAAAGWFIIQLQETHWVWHCWSVLKPRFPAIIFHMTMFRNRAKRKNGSWMVPHEWFNCYTSFPGPPCLQLLLVSLLTSPIWKGLCAYILANVRDAPARGVVIGHDHRYNSERWSKLAAAVFASRQVRVHFHRGLVHTPL